MSLWTKDKVPKVLTCLILLAPALVAGALCCSNGQGSTQGRIDESDRSSPASGPPTTSPTGIHINDILEQWSSGRQEDAVRSFLQLAATQPPPASYRPFDFSEEHFVSLPEAERDALEQKMLAKFRVLRKVARELDRRAKAALAAGDRTTAEGLLVNMKRLGTANTGPEVTLMAGLVGRAIEALADRELAHLDKERASEAPRP